MHRSCSLWHLQGTTFAVTGLVKMSFLISNHSNLKTLILTETQILKWQHDELQKKTAFKSSQEESITTLIVAILTVPRKPTHRNLHKHKLFHITVSLCFLCASATNSGENPSHKAIVRGGFAGVGGRENWIQYLSMKHLHEPISVLVES